MRQFCKLILRLHMDNLKFQGGNPGAVRHGNFINYYQFHPPECRLNVLPKHIWKKNPSKPFVVLDIGCNAGDLTIALQEYLSETLNQPCHVLGIDIDPVLIERALEKQVTNEVQFQCVDYMDTEKRNNVIKNYLDTLGVTKFNVTFCFSLTMWIHLNNGDEGLRTFLEQVCAETSMVVIEAQPWKCYRAAVKRMKLSNEEFPNYKHLKIRNDVESAIENILLNIEGVEKLTQTDTTEWGRTIQFYKTS